MLSFMMNTRFEPTGPDAVAFRDLSYNNSCGSPGPLDSSTHVCGRLWYPSPSRDPKGWTAAWLPHRCYAHGYASALSFSMKGWKGRVLKVIAEMFGRVMGATTCLAATPHGPLLAADHLGPESAPALMPVVILSHGIYAMRTTYSSLCMELASRGYLVVSVEHADGTAAAVHLHGKFSNLSEVPGVQGDWRYYSPFDFESEESPNHVAYRVAELLQVRRLLEQLNLGERVPGLDITGDDSFNLKGRLDLSRVIMMGHSFGGASVVKMAVDHPGAAAAVIAVDPWCHAWNIPDGTDALPCGEKEQEALLAAAGTGPGALLLVPRGTRHNSFTDIALYSATLGKIVELGTANVGEELPAAQALEFTIQSTLKFVQDRLQGPPGRAALVPVAADDRAEYEALFGSRVHITRASPGTQADTATPTTAASVLLSATA